MITFVAWLLWLIAVVSTAGWLYKNAEIVRPRKLRKKRGAKHAIRS